MKRQDGKYLVGSRVDVKNTAGSGLKSLDVYASLLDASAQEVAYKATALSYLPAGASYTVQSEFELDRRPTSVKAFSAGRSIGTSDESPQSDYPFRDQLDLQVTGPSGAKQALDAQREALVECAYALSPETQTTASVEASAKLQADGTLSDLKLTKYDDSSTGRACITRSILGAEMPKGVEGPVEVKLTYATKR